MTQDNDHLAIARERSLEDDSKITEAELHQSDEGIMDAWKQIQSIKADMVSAKQEALRQVNLRYSDELKTAESQYALLIHLTR